MKLLILYHNPGAGDEEHRRDKLVALIEECGFKCRQSTSNSVEGIEWESAEFVVVAGGDGTVRSLTKELLLKVNNDRNLPIALLPLGTANNIAKTLAIAGETKDIIQSWHHAAPKKFDVGIINDAGHSLFFLESFGYGVFPYLMQEMDKQQKNNLKTDEKINTALLLLHEIILSYEPKYCKLIIDGVDYSGKFLLAEIMNTCSMGPNLNLSPGGDPGDGTMEVVLVPENDKEKFASYVLKKIHSVEEVYQFQIIKASQQIQISWKGTHAHLDDEIIKLKNAETVKIVFRKGLLEFLVY